MDYLIGIDLGSSAVKTAVFDIEGRAMGMSIREYQLNIPAPGIAEIAPQTLWLRFKESLSESLSTAKVPPEDIKALAISSQGETFVILDATGRPLRPAISWYDNRATEQARMLGSQFDPKTTYQVTGMPEIIPIWTAAKILWIKQNEPEVFTKTHKYLLLEDYFIYRLTGKYVGEFSMYPSSLLFDIRSKCWWSDILEYLGIRDDQLCELRESGEPVGNISPEVASELGLSTDTLVATGAYDHAAGAIGSANVKPGVVTETTGSCLVVNSTVREATYDPKMRVPCQIHCVKDRYFMASFSKTAGMALKWFRDEFCQDMIQLAKADGRTSFEIIGQKIAEIQPGSEGLIMLPYLAGASFPEHNDNARGVLFGLSLKHGRWHMGRAIMEAVACLLKTHIQAIEELAGNVQEVISIGGGARSKLWCQIKADVLDKPVCTITTEEPSLLGAAILAGLAAGIYKDPVSAGERMVKIKERFEPNPAHSQIYQQTYDLFRKVYQQLETNV